MIRFLVHVALCAFFIPVSAQGLIVEDTTAPCASDMETFFDDFTSLDTSCRWTANTNASGTITQSGSVVTLDDPGAASDAALLTLSQFPVRRDHYWIACTSGSLDNEAGTYDIIGAVDTVAAPQGNNTFDTLYRTRSEMQATDRYQVKAFSSGHTENYWREALVDWSTSFSASYNKRDTDTDHALCLENKPDAAGNSFRWLGYGKTDDGASYSVPEGWNNFMVTDWIQWDDYEAVSDTLWLAFGDGQHDTADNQALAIDWIYFGTTGATMPDANWAYLNLATTGTSYDISAFYTHSLDYPFYVPIDRDPDVLSRGAGGTWDDAWVSRPYVVKVSGTYYMVYDGNNGSGDVQIGCATASSPEGAWTKCSNNPIISNAGGGANDARFGTVIYDNSDGTNPWKIFLGTETGTAGVYLAENSALDNGSWPTPSIKVSLGSGGSFDDTYLHPGVMDEGASKFTIFTAGYDGTAGWSMGCATSTTLEGTYTKCNSGSQIFTNSKAVTTTTDANSTGTTLNVAATTGFGAGEWLMVNASASINTPYYGRVKSINAGVSLEMYNGFSDIDSGLNVQSFSDVSQHPRALINPTGTTWYILATCFRLGGTPSGNESNCLFEGDGSDPSAITWSLSNDPWGYPMPKIFYDLGTDVNYLRQENPARITLPVN